MSSPKTINWGILATGGIATTFARDLTVDPATRNVHEVKHRIIAAASSSSAERAGQFLKDVKADSDAKPYGSYEELVKDSNVQIIYVATPHSHHYQNVRLCLEAGKNVLCEKAFTTNAAQAKKLFEIAKQKNLFLLEAVWTRFFPLSVYVRQIITSGKLGPIHRVFADDSMSKPPATTYADGKHRLVNPSLAGGALLDLGIYSLTWLFQTVYHTQPVAQRRKPAVLSSVKKFENTGVDDQTSMLLTFDRQSGDNSSGAIQVHGIATTSFYVSSYDKDRAAGPSVRVQGEKGEVVVFGPIHRPALTRLILNDGSTPVEEKEWKQPGPGQGSGFFNGFGAKMQPEGEGQGMFWQADEAGRCLLAGKQESDVLPWSESVDIMETMDEVRRQAGLKFPDDIESLDYPLKLG